ncbi:MAG: Serine phosphatase RsbU, regulator of sigma subunit [uncultured Craurococcus sp.]|uniref:Serine phosphatase RsbU, regulator of sigma subunit n=1 Tax=uncultured Craurococcus sp. TaxID=1135998 RepID=A0A6J4HDC3_9PROT|nr:MAG: Serine phosphatase RsbU, regulator of sigma subunit [uncultured Craurococcus sp.]
MTVCHQVEDSPVTAPPADNEETMMRRSPRLTEAPEPMLHVLVLAEEGGGTRRIPLGPAPFRIGRVAGNDLVLPAPEVSRSHAVLTVMGDGASLADLGSTNGTWLEGERLGGSAALAPGARLAIGPFALQYQRGRQREMERAAELEREMERAFRYVQALLPPPIPEGRVRAEWSFLPSASIGGDAFGYRWLDADRFAVFVLDVAGHGAGSSLLAASVMNMLRAGVESDPAAALAGLNAAFQMEQQGGLFFTIWYGVADLAARRIDFAAAGHHAGYLLSPGAAPEALGIRNPPVGMVPGIAFRTGSAPLPPGARLLLFSDGAFETRAPDGRQLGLGDLLPHLPLAAPPAAGAAERLLQAARSLCRPGPFEDDVSILSLDFA